MTRQNDELNQLAVRAMRAKAQLMRIWASGRDVGFWPHDEIECMVRSMEETIVDHEEGRASDAEREHAEQALLRVESCFLDAGFRDAPCCLGDAFSVPDIGTLKADLVEVFVFWWCGQDRMVAVG